MTRKTHASHEVALFTGFPGFLGARLLPRLLELSPGAVFKCLVQEKFLGLAKRELEQIEATHAHTRGRIALVLGDITRERLGIEAAEAKVLQRQITSAYHLAAIYDLAVKRDVGMKINVEGTRRVLEFLAECSAFDRLHYISTAYVSGTAVGLYRETDLDVGQSFKNYYEETKFLAEVEVVRVGLPAVIYRPGIVVGDSRTGETAKFDGPYFALRAMTRLPSPGVFMKVGSGQRRVSLVPVDFVIEALAHLAQVKDAVGRTYHLTHPDPPTVFEVEELFARALGKSFVYAPVPLALAKLSLAPGPVQKLLGIPVQSLDYFDHPVDYDCSQATRDLARSGVTCPRFSSFVQRLVAFYLEKQNSVRREAMV
jgi:thioester reductase-like protein